MSFTVLRRLGALSLVLMPLAAVATDPASGTLNSTSSTSLTAKGGPYLLSNPSGAAAVSCDLPMSCDSYALTVELPTTYAASNPNDTIEIELVPDAATDDLDLRLLDASGAQVGSSGNSFGETERISIKAGAGTQTFTVQIVPFAVANTTATLNIKLVKADTNAVTDPCQQSGAASAGARVTPSFYRSLKALGSGIGGAYVRFSYGTEESRRALLSRHGLSVAQSFYPYANSVYVKGPASALLALIKEPSITALEENTRLRYFSDTGTWASRVRVAQEAVSGGPYYDPAGNILDGTGITVSVVDSGLLGAHPDFAGRILHNYALKGDDAGGATAPPVDVGYTNSDTTGGHGTHCVGIAAGGGIVSDPQYPLADVAPTVRGTYSGAAPKANIVAYGAGETLVILAPDTAFKHILDNYDPKDPNRIRVVSNSYGDTSVSYDPGETTSCLAKAMVAKGIALTYAAGNSGGDGTTDMTSSTCKDTTPGVICVAWYDDQNSGTTDGTLDPASSRGKFGDQSSYPDIAAPGGNITATCAQPVPGQGVCATGAETKWQPWYGTISGTSMATPQVAGALALLFQAKPDLTPAQAEKLLQDTARPAGKDDYEADSQNPGGRTNVGWGAGLMDLQAALDKLGIRKAGLPTSGLPYTIFDGDTDSTSDTAADITKLVLQETTVGGSAGLLFRLSVADASAAGFSTSSAIGYTVEMNAAGKHFATTVLNTGGDISIAEAGSGNTAVAATAMADGNDIVFFVPYFQLGFPQTGGPIHNIRAFSTSDALSVEDRAPSPMGTNTNAPEASVAGNIAEDLFPAYGRAFTVQLPSGSPPPSTERSCTLPGLTQALSPEGAANTTGLPIGAEDLRQAWLAEPKDMPGKLVFTIKVADLAAVPPGHRWYMYFKVRGGDGIQHFVAMDAAASPTPRFVYGDYSSTTDTTGELPAVGGFGLFTIKGDLDSTSNYNADGTITLVLDKATYNIAAGQKLIGVAASIRQTSNPDNGIGLTVDSGAAAGPYTVVGNSVCAAPSGGTVDTGRRGGGALGLLLVLPGLALAALRRRRRH